LNGVVLGSWKYIRAPREELYDLAHDSAETNNVVVTQAQVAQGLRERLEEMLQDLESAASPPDDAAVDPDAVKRLQSLGYVGGGVVPTGSGFNPKLEDPKDFMKTFERLEDANALFNSNRAKEAETALLAILAERPRLVAAHEQLAQIARSEHRVGDVVEHEAAIVAALAESANASKQDPAVVKSLATAQFNLAFALRDAGREGDAIGRYQEAVRLEPGFVDARNSLGLALARAGKYDEAIAQYEAALRIQPAQAQVQNNFGNALLRTGKTAEAIRHYEEALRIEPKSVSALTNLALLRATDADPSVRNGEEAVRLAERACAVTGPSNLGCLETLAAAYAEAKRFDEAVSTAERAAGLARAAQQEAMAVAIDSRLALYRDHRPYHVPAVPKAGSK
jgi:tetratricopeptide (TPR) repeat protein